MNTAIYNYDRRASMSAKDVLARLAPLVSRWLADPHGHKQPIFDAYNALTDEEKALLDEDVRDTFAREHGGSTVIAYKLKGHPHHGGAALTTKKPNHLLPEKTLGYLIRAKDVMFHWGQEELPLTQDPLGEEIVLLKPDANPLPFG